MMQIGVVKEQLDGECRVALVPDVVRKLVKKGFEVVAETASGLSAGYPDADYDDAGALLADRATALSADIVVHIRKPTLQDAAAMREGTVLITLIETCEEDPVVHALHEKNITIIAMERIPRISRAQSMDALSSQSNIAGYRAVIEAASHFGRFLPLMMTSAGSAKPARVVILGVGVAGLQAIATARRLGGDVYAYDIRPETQEQIESLGAKPIKLDIGESGSGEGGYAKELSDDAKQRQQSALAEELSKAHVIISTALIPCRPAPVLVPENVVENMRHGSVIIDMAAATGGNCPLSEAHKVVQKHGVTIVGHTNYPALMPTDSSSFYANNIFNLLDIMVEKKDDALVLKDLSQDEITDTAVMPVVS